MWLVATGSDSADSPKYSFWPYLSNITFLLYEQQQQKRQLSAGFWLLSDSTQDPCWDPAETQFGCAINSQENLAWTD